ncbi:MAG: SsrA-binding protein SmpB [Alphaproteobacteria bacterium]|nr:SsrA-binding protein SmpB [Alphaproteobacteria bacterium]
MNAEKERFRLVAQNRKARHDYFIEDTLEAGIMLKGSEVKSLRMGRASLVDAYAAERKGELFLFNAHIPEYPGASRFNHEPKQARKLLLHKRQMNKFFGASAREGMTIIPLSIYFNKRGIAKVELALARGKAQHDKRRTIAEREWRRQQGRLMREKG